MAFFLLPKMSRMATAPDYDAGTSSPFSEEWANSLTHALGAILSVAASAALLVRVARNHDWMQFVGCTVYVASLVAVYTASSLSHFVQRHPWRRHFRALDQACIYLLIVGTYTPAAVTYLYGGGLSLLFWTMWGVALFGVLSKLLLRYRIEGISTVTYVVLGWMPILGARTALATISPAVLCLFFAGGLCYTGGVYFLVNDHRVRYFHAVWHLLVMAGSAFHFLAVYGCIAA
jgi:hemolysin III